MLKPVASTSHVINSSTVPATNTMTGTLPTPFTSVAYQRGPIANSAKSLKSISGKYKCSTKIIKQSIRDKIAEMPRRVRESRTQYARRISDKFPQLTRMQLADCVGVVPDTISGSILFRGETLGYKAMKHEQKDKDESKTDFAVRLKKLYPNFSYRDYAQVSGAVNSTLAEHPKFQTVTEKVLWARNSVEAQRRTDKEETVTAWGVRLYREHGLRWGECSAVTGRKASLHRSAGLRAGARLGDRMKKEPMPLPLNLGDKTRLNSLPVVTPELQRDPEEQESLAMGAVQHALTQAAKQPSLETDQLPELNAEALLLSLSYDKPVASSTVPNFNIRPNLVEINNIANWMLRAPGSFNNQLGDLVIPLLLNSGELPPNTVIAVTTKGEATHYFRGENSPITLQEAMHHEYKIELHRVVGETHVATGSASNAHYNLLHNGLLVPNFPDGDCLYRAILQRSLLMPGYRQQHQIQKKIAEHGDFGPEIQYLRDCAANAFINSPDRYLDLLDRQILAAEYAQIVARRAGIDTPVRLSNASSITDVDSLTSNVSTLSLSEADSPASNIKSGAKGKIRRGMTGLLPRILADVREAEPGQPEILLNKIRDSQIVGRAAFGVMSGEAETAGTLVLMEVADILLITLEKYPELATNVFTALMPANLEEQVEFINTLPLIMGHLAGLKVTQLFNQLSKDSGRKKVLLTSLHKKHIADRPSPVAYIGSMNFFQRMNIASRRISLLLPRPSQSQPLDEVINTLMKKTDQIFLLSTEQLKSSGLVEKPSFMRRVRSSLSHHKPKEVTPQTSPLENVDADKLVVTGDILRQALETDSRSVERFENQRNRLREIYYQSRAQMDERASQSLRASTSSAGRVAGGLLMQNEGLRRESNAEREERDALYDAQKNVSRAERDYHNDFLGRQAPNLIPVAAQLAIHVPSSSKTSVPLPQHPFSIPAQIVENNEDIPFNLSEFENYLTQVEAQFGIDVEAFDPQIFEQQVDRLMEQYLEEDGIEVNQALPAVPLYEPLMEINMPDSEADLLQARHQRTREALLKD